MYNEGVETRKALLHD